LSLTLFDNESIENPHQIAVAVLVSVLATVFIEGFFCNSLNWIYTKERSSHRHCCEATVEANESENAGLNVYFPSLVNVG